MKKIMDKLTSRKFWVALAGVVCGVAISLGAEGSEIQSVCGTVTALISLITYIAVEGKVDAERIKTLGEEPEEKDVNNNEDC